MKCKVISTIVEGRVYSPGEEIELTPERARQLSGYVKAVKSFDGPPKDKMVGKPANKKSRKRKK